MEEKDDGGVFNVFSDYGDQLAKEVEVREELRSAVKEMEKASREIHTLLQKIHKPGGVKKFLEISAKAEEKFSIVRESSAALDGKIPEGSYWKYSQIWSSTNSWVSFLASYTLYLKDENLPNIQQVSDLLGMSSNPNQLHLDLEEYLIGLCHLCNELSRVAVNSVTSQDYGRPVRIAEFLNSLNTGFRLLNLKNDNLRKRFDSIKYDLKKVEEVVYDLSIRGLVNKEEEGETVSKQEAVSKEEAGDVKD